MQSWMLLTLPLAIIGSSSGDHGQGEQQDEAAGHGWASLQRRSSSWVCGALLQLP